MVSFFNLQGVSDSRIGPDVTADIVPGQSASGTMLASPKTIPGVKLPSVDTFVVYCSDGSGTSFIITDYLSKVSKDWKRSRQGRGAPVRPRGIGAKGNEGAAGFVRQSPGSIGYVELIYAMQNKIPVCLGRKRRRNLGSRL